MSGLYGISNCDRCRAAAKWLAAQGSSLTLTDIRKTPPDATLWRSFLDALGAGQLINKRSTTWRQLSEQERALAESDPQALLRANPTLMKRPLLAIEGEMQLGFDADSALWQRAARR